MKVNLKGIEAATVQESTYKSVKKGLQPLTITEVVDTVAASGSEGIEITFQATDGATFKHKFWASVKALPRLVYLIEKFTDGPSPESIDTESVSALLVGKTKNVVVDAESRTSKDGKYVNEYPTLRFAGFVNPEGKDAEPRLEDKTIQGNQQSSSSILNATTEDKINDLPF
jgi:hypothetical protein